jgi:3-oxoacyl-[acyl-carrier protein] reductase
MTRTAIVTGASGGIGQGVAERLAKDGFAVVAHYAGNPAKAEETVKRIEAAGGTAIAVGADISKVAEVAQLFEKAKSAFGEITVVVNSAGIMLLAPIRKGDIENFDKVIATNLRGSYLVMSEAANHVVDGGRIIVFSSSVLGKSFPSYGAYIASKAGVEGLTRVLANELGPRKITVNAVAPGPVATELFLNGKSEELIASISKMAPRTDRRNRRYRRRRIASRWSRGRLDQRTSHPRQWRLYVRKLRLLPEGALCSYALGTPWDQEQGKSYSNDRSSSFRYRRGDRAAKLTHEDSHVVRTTFLRNLHRILILHTHTVIGND